MSLLQIPFRVTNRSGQPLEGARVQILLILAAGNPGPRGQAVSDLHGEGVVLINLKGTFSFDAKVRAASFVEWIDPDGVSWELSADNVWGVAKTFDRRHLSTETRKVYVVTSRTFPQVPLPPDLSVKTRSSLSQLLRGRELLHTYDECRDALIAGFPDSSAVLAGKAIETAIILRGESRDWPVDDWVKKRYAVGDYLRETEVERDLISAFSRGFYRLMNGANVARVLGAHQVFGHIDLLNARAVQSDVTKLVEGWFGTATD